MGIGRGYRWDAALAVALAGSVLADALLAAAQAGERGPLDYLLLLAATLVLVAGWIGCRIWSSGPARPDCRSP